MRPAPLEADWCPECGGAPVITENIEMVQVCCDECTFYVEAETEDVAVVAWNNHERYEL